MDCSKFVKTIFCFLLSCVLVACKREKYHEPDVYDRVVLYYLDGKDNNLSSHITNNYFELREGYLPASGTTDVILVYIHTDWWPARLVRLTRDDGYVSEQVIKEFDFEYSSKPDVFRQVLNFVARRFPAYQNGLLVSNHGSGYLPGGYYNSPSSYVSYKSDNGFSASPGVRPLPLVDDYDYYTTGTKSIGKDESNCIDIQDFAELLPIKYDYIIFDCCLMGCVEVAYQLRNRTDNIVFSQTEILATGMNYQTMSEALLGKGSPDLIRVCEDYMNLYINNPDPSATVSYVRTGHIGELASVCNKIMSYSTENIKSLNRGRLQPFFRSYYPVSRDFFYDLDDYVKSLATENDYAQFRNCMDSVVVYANHTDYFMIYDRGFQIERNCGFSTYVPLNYRTWHKYLNEHYRMLDWFRDVYGEEGCYFPYL